MVGSHSRAKAINAAEWIDVSVRGLGCESQFQGPVWFRGPTAPTIYPAAVILGTSQAREAVSSTLAGLLASWGPALFYLWDVGANHDLTRLGLVHLWTRPWYLRDPSPFIAPESAITLARAKDGPALQAFERASKAGNESEHDAERWHAACTLNDERVSYLLGYLADHVVVSGVTFESAGMVGLYELSTLPTFRRRGYAQSLVYHVVQEHAHRRLGVWPDPISVPIYVNAGFVVGGQIAAWTRE